MPTKSQVIRFQISVWVGSVINITCLHYCSLMSSSSLLENCDNIYLIPISWELSYSYFLSADFQSPQMSFLWAWRFGFLLLPHLYWNLIPFILLILVRRVFFLDKGVSQIWELDVHFSICEHHSFCSEKKVCAFLIYLLQRQLRIVICYFHIVLVSSGCASHGVLNTLVTFTSDFDYEPLYRIVIGTLTFLVILLSPFLTCLACCAKWWPHSVPVLPPSPWLLRSFFKDVINSSEAFQLIRLAWHFPKMKFIGHFSPPSHYFGTQWLILQMFIERQLSAEDMDTMMRKKQKCSLVESMVSWERKTSIQ